MRRNSRTNQLTNNYKSQKMKHTKITFMALAGAFIMASCGESKKENAADEPGLPMQNEMHQENPDAMTGNLDDGQMNEVEFKDDRIAAVYDTYNEIRSSLVNTNAQEAQNGGEKLVAALEGVENNAEALQAARTIANSQAVNEQRTAFLELSAAVEEMVTGAVASGQLYKQYCPMAFDGEGGAWLSASQDIRNPYYGDKMLKCGSVRDTIQ